MNYQKNPFIPTKSICHGPEVNNGLWIIEGYRELEPHPSCCYWAHQHNIHKPNPPQISFKKHPLQVLHNATCNLLTTHTHIVGHPWNIRWLKINESYKITILFEHPPTLEKALLSNEIMDYHVVAQGKTSIPGVDDGEEMELTDVRPFRFATFTARKNRLKLEIRWKWSAKGLFR